MELLLGFCIGFLTACAIRIKEKRKKLRIIIDKKKCADFSNKETTHIRVVR